MAAAPRHPLLPGHPQDEPHRANSITHVLAQEDHAEDISALARQRQPPLARPRRVARREEDGGITLDPDINRRSEDDMPPAYDAR